MKNNCIILFTNKLFKVAKFNLQIDNIKYINILPIATPKTFSYILSPFSSIRIALYKDTFFSLNKTASIQ